MTEATLSRLRQLQSSVTEAPRPDTETFEVGPFRAWISATQSLIWLNYAIPIAEWRSEREVSEAIAVLRHEFAERRRILRFEFFDESWPGLPSILDAAGLAVQAVQPLMICTPEDLRPFQASDVRVHLLTPDDREGIATFLSVQIEGFGEDLGRVSKERVAQMARDIRESGLRAALATLADQPAGTGAITAYRGVGELVGVTTVPSLRRHGVASTLSAYLTYDHFARGNDLAWLSAADQIAQAVYARIGYRLAGRQLNYIDADPSRSSMIRDSGSESIRSD